MEKSLTKIASLKACGAFADFKWDEALSAGVSLKPRNVIFGWNGSGKTTLSKVFRAVENWQSDKADPNSLPGGWEVRLQVQGETAFALKQDKIAKLPPVYVFNRDFVQQSVVGIQGPLSPVITLGKDSADDAAKLKKLLEERAVVERDQTAAIQKQAAAAKDWDSKCSAGAKKIKDDLGGRNVPAFRNFEAPAFKKRFEAFANDPSKFAAARLIDDELNTQLNTVSAEAKEAIAGLEVGPDDLAATLRTAAEVCGRSIVVAAIQSLENTPDVEAWLRTGLALHEKHEATHCLYCGQDLPEGKTLQLKAHFDAAYDQLLADIEASSKQLAEAKKALEALSKAIAVPDAILKHLRGEYTKARTSLIEQITTRTTVIDAAIQYLQTRQSKPLKEFTVTVHSVPPLDGGSVNKLIDQHNEGVADQTKLVKGASDKVADHVLSEYESAWTAHDAAVKANEAQIDKLANRADGLDEQIAELRKVVEGHASTASALNRDLKDYLGHDDLSLLAVENGYKLQRRGADTNVDSLSEGEKTALAVLYFLRCLDDKKVDRTKSLIVIDDPVSSLDSNALYAAITFVCNRLDDAGQVILLTHSFTAFREWKKWAGKAKGGSEHFQCKAIANGGERHCTIGKLDELLQNYETEYHYLFSYVARVADGKATASELLPLPNIARRVLEAFLAFKRPRPAIAIKGGNGRRSQDLDLDEHKGKLKGCTDEQLGRLDRFVNSFSHNDRVHVPGSDLTPLAEAKRHAQDLLDFMAALDTDHVAEMKKLDAPPQAAASPAASAST
ncbi:MAG: AAA family ATPase [Planctomycetes bacterium]|nr:AAA family ATPase [Planctomycetota bacterium]MCW8137022.1 AAA family ATPase [Planctomycetota bacterium]